MGLDMYVYARGSKPATAVDFAEAEDDEQVAYFRKHPDLHGWMEKLYREKGGTAEDFNLRPVLLTSEDIDRLERDVQYGRLPKTTGFFFGQSGASDRDDTLAFIREAREAIEGGKTLFYVAWW